MRHWENCSGFPKEELPKGHTKDQMRRFMDEEPELFQTYALRDAEITARYIRRVEEECSGLGLDNYRPVTVGGLAVRTFIRKLEENGHSYDSIMGTAKEHQRRQRQEQLHLVVWQSSMRNLP